MTDDIKWTAGSDPVNTVLLTGNVVDRLGSLIGENELDNFVSFAKTIDPDDIPNGPGWSKVVRWRGVVIAMTKHRITYEGATVTVSLVASDHECYL